MTRGELDAVKLFILARKQTFYRVFAFKLNPYNLAGATLDVKKIQDILTLFPTGEKKNNKSRKLDKTKHINIPLPTPHPSISTGLLQPYLEWPILPPRSGRRTQ